MPYNPQLPLVVSYGMGVDSTAMLVGMHQRGIVPALVLFADVGGEKPETYAFKRVMNEWLERVGFPGITTVRYKLGREGKFGNYSTLEENCVVNKTLPSLSYGFKKCSIKWKHEPMDEYVRALPVTRTALAAGKHVQRAIGYDDGAVDARRAWNLTSTDEWLYWYPLREWHWDREECKKQIKDAGLPVPEKSSCFFCPAMKPWELDALDDAHPEYLARIAKIESSARSAGSAYAARGAAGEKTTEGLWQAATKGTGAGKAYREPHPATMAEYLTARREWMDREPAAGWALASQRNDMWMAHAPDGVMGVVRKQPDGRYEWAVWPRPGRAHVGGANYGSLEEAQVAAQWRLYGVMDVFTGGTRRSMR